MTDMREGNDRHAPIAAKPRPRPQDVLARFIDATPSRRQLMPRPKMHAEMERLVTFVSAFRRAVETEFIDGREPPLWLRNGYDDARELLGLDAEMWPAPWEREA